ncbi:hypothetical protein [Paraburkholderia franconis]|uniref:hypothetical protein n=1 Tax=Paraburkholderia franconis TaxID=2654983 RepID=UPI003898E177
MVNAGLSVIVATISPIRDIRESARALFGDYETTGTPHRSEMRLPICVSGFSTY